MKFNLYSFYVKTIGLNSPTKPYGFIVTSFKSDLDLLPILTDLTKLVPQFGNFVEQFNTLINENSINVITDAKGNLSIDVPSTMTESKSSEIANKVNILDRLISTQKESIGNLFFKGSLIENKFKSENPDYKSQLEGLRKNYITFRDSYKH